MISTDPGRGFLVWICPRHAINPANVVYVFHGLGGEVQITFVNGRHLEVRDTDLSPEGRELLLLGEPTDPASNLRGHAALTIRHPMRGSD